MTHQSAAENALSKPKSVYISILFVNYIILLPFDIFKKSELLEFMVIIHGGSCIMKLRGWMLGGMIMWISQLLPSKKEEKIQKSDVYDQLQAMVGSILKREVPSGNSLSHLLYHANVKIQQYHQAAEYHRKRIDMSTALGIFHKEAYELAIKKGRHLQRLVDSFIMLNIEDERERINHRMMLVDDRIEKLFMEFQHREQIIPEMEEQFWDTLKEDIMPILSDLN